MSLNIFMFEKDYDLFSPTTMEVQIRERINVLQPNTIQFN